MGRDHRPATGRGRQQMAEGCFLDILQGNEDRFGFRVDRGILAFDQLETGTGQRPLQPTGPG